MAIDPAISRGADFFLSSGGETDALAAPRSCWQIARMSDSFRDDWMLISIEPPFRQRHGIGYRDVYKLLIATKVKDHSLYPITSWPCPVYVCRLLHESVASGTEFTANDVQLIAWAMLFRTLGEAEQHYKSFFR